MNKFRKLGLIEYNGRIDVHSLLLRLVLHDQPLGMPAGLEEPPATSLAERYRDRSDASVLLETNV
jgi:hypothetical protein